MALIRRDILKLQQPRTSLPGVPTFGGAPLTSTVLRTYSAGAFGLKIPTFAPRAGASTLFTQIKPPTFFTGQDYVGGALVQAVGVETLSLPKQEFRVTLKVTGEFNVGSIGVDMPTIDVPTQAETRLANIAFRGALKSPQLKTAYPRVSFRFVN